MNDFEVIFDEEVCVSVVGGFCGGGRGVGGCGAAFAATGACESNYLTRVKNGELPNTLGDASSLHLSEQFLPWFHLADPRTGKSFSVYHDKTFIPVAERTSADITVEGKDALASAAYTVEMPNPELKLYNHDDLGWILSWGEGSTTAWGASVFKSGTGSESVKEIAFYTTDNNASYELFVYDLGTTAPTSPTAGARVASKSGSFELAGYHTVAVEAKSSIAAGHYFSVVLKLTNPTTDSPVAASGKMQYISDGAVINAGEGYVSADGASWTDGVNIEYTFTGTVTPQNLKGIAPCVKVFTVAAEDTPEPTSTPTQTPTGGGNSSSGCDAGLLGVAGLGSIILATGLALRGKRK